MCVCMSMCLCVYVYVREKYMDIYKNHIIHIKAFIKKSNRYHKANLIKYTVQIK